MSFSIQRCWRPMISHNPLCTSTRRVAVASRSLKSRATYRPRERIDTSTQQNSVADRSSRGGMRLLFISGGFFLFTAATYGSYIIFKGDAPEAKPNRHIPEDVSDRYDTTAPTFDKDIRLQEALMGIGWLRWLLIRKAEGNVLEVSVGTGRNSHYYNLNRCHSVVMLDKSPEMVKIARSKFKESHPSFKRSSFLTQSALDPIPKPTDGYDVVIQTMGLCSTPDPVGLLRNIASVVSPAGGKILLLEHGRSYYAWLNRILDSGAPHHADRYGCWWNKDIGEIIAESGLEVVSIKRYHFGTTWSVELRPRREG